MLDAVGQYKILGPIGVGRMGELFRARDTRAGRTVALRIVAADIATHPDRRRQLLTDARAAAALSHPSIATLYEVGDEGSVLYLVSEFVPGDSLRTAIAGRALHPRHALDHGVQLADALAEGHARGLLHRDIHPGSIIITPKGMAKFIDFGFGAWTTSGAERRRIASVSGDNAGSSELVSYMAPEEVLGHPVDERADVFSLGVVLFEIVAGAPPPLVAPSADARTIDVLLAPPPPPSAINPALPKELDALLIKMLARNVDDRPAGAAAVSAEMRSIASLLDARDDAAPLPVAASERRQGRQGLWIGVALIALAVIAAFLFFSR
jgi:serine/threonine-protein kinase